jgi:ferritin-like metal-binding protein YciE
MRAQGPLPRGVAAPMLERSVSLTQENAMTSLQTLADLYVFELKQLWSANDQMASALRDLAPHSTHPKLRRALESSLARIDDHTRLLMALIENQDEAVVKEHSKGMEGLVKEGLQHVAEQALGKGPVLDAAIIGRYQQMTHYGITGFATMAAFSKALNLQDDNGQLMSAVQDMHAVDELMTELAEDAVNVQAARG